MRDRLKGALRSSQRTWHGNVPGPRPLSDVDLAIIDDQQRACVFCELKWFLEPAEPREILERGEEVERGIAQLRELKTAWEEHYRSLFKILRVTPDYGVAFALVSANSIGPPWSQDAAVPAVNEDHLRLKLKDKSLLEVVDWLNSRSFLPKAGRHFELISHERRVGKWSLRWHGTRVIDPTLP